MDIFRKLGWAGSTGDAIPPYHSDVYHIFSLTSPLGTAVYSIRLRTTQKHSVSKDLAYWEEVETALYSEEDEGSDACDVWTDAAMCGEKKCRTFYTGYNYNVHFRRTICRVVSDDSIHFKKDPKNPIIMPNEEEYEVVGWRDPYMLYNKNDSCWQILMSRGKKEGPPSRRKYIVPYRSKDLDSQEYYEPTYQPYHTSRPEYCEMYRIGALWYLSCPRFPEPVSAVYRMTGSSFGPWRTPKTGGMGGRRFYAAESLVNDEGRRFHFAWMYDRA